MTRQVFPYRVPSTDVVTEEPWFLVVEDEPLPLPDALPDWDYHTDLSLRRTVRVDIDRARAQCGLSSEAKLGIAVTWTATGSNLGGPAARVPLLGHGAVSETVEVELRGVDLGGLVVLDTALVLTEHLHDARPASPHRAGSVLWRDHASVRLQGDAPQFPMAIIDFGLTSFPEQAAWHLQIDGSLDSAAMGSLLLLVNERNIITATAFKRAGAPGPVDRVVLSAVQADTARSMIEHALVQDDFNDDSDFPDGSLGATMLTLFYRLFPDQSVEDIRSRRRRSPNLFASELQAAVKIFEGNR